MAIPIETKFAVFLTEHALENLRGDSIFSLLKKDKYFLCDKINPDGNYFFMHIIDERVKGLEQMWEISIPHTFVLYVLSGAKEKIFGFIS